MQLLILTAISIGFATSFSTPREHPATELNRRPKRSALFAMSVADTDRLLLSEPALNAFIVAEMRDFLEQLLEQNDSPGGNLTKWVMTDEDRVFADLTDERGVIINEEYAHAKSSNVTGDAAIDLLCNTTAATFRDGFVNQPGLLSALGAAILYFRDAYRTGANLAACERIGVSDYAVAHHITDMYHHRNFRGTYTKTLLPSGKGEIAARVAVGLDQETGKGGSLDTVGLQDSQDDDDECILWSPTTPDSCIHWKSDDEEWRKKRFERIQMEGTKDPRRGGSGTLR